MGAISPNADERQWRDAELQRVGGEYQQMDEREKRRRSALFSKLRITKGQKLDPANSRHAALLDEAADLGFEIDPDSWNDAGSNLAPITYVDPDNPTQRRRGFINKVTGEITDAGQADYVAPVHGDTEMTAAQEGADSDRDAARELSARRAAETERHNRRTEEIASGRFELSKSNSLSGSAKRSFDIATKGKFEEARRLGDQIRSLRTRAAKRELSPAAAAEQGAALQKQLDALESDIEAHRQAALSKHGGGTTYTEAEVRARAKARGQNEDAAVEAARKKGLLK